MTFLFVSLSYTAESAIVTAFITFIPKFIESQFGIPASNASIYTGTCFHHNSNHSIFIYSSLTLLCMISFLVVSHIAHGSHSVPHITEHVKNEMWIHVWYFFSQLCRFFCGSIFESYYIKLYMLLWVCITGSQDAIKISLLLIYINPQKHIALCLRLYIIIKPYIYQNISAQMFSHKVMGVGECDLLLSARITAAFIQFVYCVNEWIYKWQIIRDARYERF